MIIRYNCFETNSSSTHALCIAKGGFKQPYKLISDYINNWSFEDDLPKSDKYIKLNKNRKDKSYDDDYILDNKPKVLYLRRFENIGRVFDIFNSPESKLNFIWSVLITNYKYKDGIKERKNIDIEVLLKMFLEYLYTNNFVLKFLDIDMFSKRRKLKDSWSDYQYLGQFPDYDFIPKEFKNKYMYGESTWGYYPLEELDIIIRNELLFWNLILGNSKIYTGSDENDLFEDLNFDNYSYNLVGGSDSSICQSYNIFKHVYITKIGEYKNGNYITKIYADGTRTRELNPKETFYDQGLYRENKFKIKEIDMMEPDFPENIDLKITNYCENNCKFCYANSNKEGKHADTNFIKSIITQMHPYTEIAIGGGNALAHPDLLEILQHAKEHNVICNITLKDVDIINNKELISKLYQDNLIKALGVSPTTLETVCNAIGILNDDCYKPFILHVILGIHNREFLEKIEQKEYIPAILFLGYKQKGNGVSYFNSYKDTIAKNIEEIKNMKYNELVDISRTISFDNLAIKQLELDVENKYKDLYQGDDGKFSFYIDGVDEMFAKNSMEEKLYDFYSIKESFDKLRKDRNV